MIKIDVRILKVTKLDELDKLNLSFEEAYQELEKITKIQEQDISLKDNIMYYKLGKLLVKYCQHILDKAQREIENSIE